MSTSTLFQHSRKPTNLSQSKAIRHNQRFQSGAFADITHTSFQANQGQHISIKFFHILLYKGVTTTIHCPTLHGPWSAMKTNLEIDQYYCAIKMINICTLDNRGQGGLYTIIQINMAMVELLFKDLGVVLRNKSILIASNLFIGKRFSLSGGE